MDADHLGNLAAVLELAPQATVITNFLGMAKMGLLGHDTSRVQLIGPGEELDLGDRTARAAQAALLRRPGDHRLLRHEDARPAQRRRVRRAPAGGETDAAAIDPETLREGMLKWAAIDAPWLSTADPRAFGELLRNIERLDPSAIISGTFRWRAA